MSFITIAEVDTLPDFLSYCVFEIIGRVALLYSCSSCFSYFGYRWLLACMLLLTNVLSKKITLGSWVHPCMGVEQSGIGAVHVSVTVHVRRTKGITLRCILVCGRTVWHSYCTCEKNNISMLNLQTNRQTIRV
jgi:hypothetical protein